jgi:hypothetical protein
MERLLEVAGILAMGGGLLVGPSDPHLLRHIGLLRPTLESEAFYNPRSGEEVSCVREPDAPDGNYATLAMIDCAAKYLRRGFVPGWMPSGDVNITELSE